MRNRRIVKHTTEVRQDGEQPHHGPKHIRVCYLQVFRFGPLAPCCKRVLACNGCILTWLEHSPSVPFVLNQLM